MSNKQSFLESTTHTVSWFHKRIQDGELELTPPFQRNPVWSNKQKSYLIDTILRGYPIPELYMQEYTDANGDDHYTVVDGQQRIRACEDFISGKFQIDPEDTPEWGDMRFDDLSEDYKKQLYGYKFAVRVLPSMSEVEIRSMFQRLNRNVVALNKQELRHATYWGDFITSMERIADDERWSFIAVFSPNDVRRMIDIEFISEIAIGYLHGLQNKKDTLDDWYQAYEAEYEYRYKVETVFNTVLGELVAVIPDIERTRWRKKSDFYTLFLCLAEYSEHLPLDRSGRESLRSTLLQFASDVDRFIRDPVANDGVSDNVKNYVVAVERAASDLSSRKQRRENLMAVLKDILAPPAAASPANETVGLP